MQIQKRTLVQAATVGALLAATLAGSLYIHGVVQDDKHRQRQAAAEQLSLEIDNRIQKALAAEEGVYGLSNGQPDFGREQFEPFGRRLIRQFGLSYVGWAPAVAVGERSAFEEQSGLKVAGSGATEAGILVPLLYSVHEVPRQPGTLRPGLNLLSDPDVGPPLVDSAEAQDPSVSGRARVRGEAGVVLVQPMFGFDETGEGIVGWVVAGVRSARLVDDSRAFLPGDANVHVTVDGTSLYGPLGAVDPQDIAPLSVGQSSWLLSVTNIVNDLSLLAPWLVLAVGLALTTLISALFWQGARIDHGRRRELERLAQAALVDSLTGLRNHRAFQEDLGRELRRHTRTGEVLSLAVLDIEGLKQVNDTLGHQEGDERLKRLADRLRHTTRGSDAVYRLGGDEFALLLPETNAWESFLFVQRLQETLAADPENVRVAVAVGVADTTGLEARDALIRRASLALVEAKRSQRNVLIYSEEFEPEHGEPSEENEEHHTRTLATALAQAVDAKDSGTRSHCETVSQLCVMIAEQLGLPAKRIAELRLAGLLHDVGKIGIPDAILQKPAKLTDDEFEVMKTHSALGRSIVEAAGRPQEALWILHHHERPDGSGYPAGLRGDELPLESRIILVADAFEAITSDRPYRKHAPVAEALAELERHAGTQFDPSCVAALKQAIAGGSAISSESSTAVSLRVA